MSDIEITDDDIEAVTDPAVCRLADTIVLRNQGCGNASVLIDRFVKQVRHEARVEALEEAQSAIANLPTGKTEDVMEGHEQAYRAIEALSSGEREG